MLGSSTLWRARGSFCGCQRSRGARSIEKLGVSSLEIYREVEMWLEGETGGGERTVAFHMTNRNTPLQPPMGTFDNLPLFFSVSFWLSENLPANLCVCIH